MDLDGVLVGRRLLLSAGVTALAGGAVSPAHAVGKPRILVGEHNGYDFPADIDRYTASAGAKPDMVMWFQSWDEPLYYGVQMAGVAARGVTPLITWSPGPSFAMADLLAGRHDSYIVRQAALARAWEKPLMVRPFHEMNGTWQSFGPQRTSGRDFVRGWRRVVDLFRTHGATNVAWVWSPNITGFDSSTHPMAPCYPGDSYVDWAALDGYNYGEPWRDGRTLFAASYKEITSLTRKPLMIAEWGTTERFGSKAAWIRDFFEQIPLSMPRVSAIVSFSRVAEEDFRIDSSSAALAAYRAALRSPRFTRGPYAGGR